MSYSNSFGRDQRPYRQPAARMRPTAPVRYERKPVRYGSRAPVRRCGLLVRRASGLHALRLAGMVVLVAALLGACWFATTSLKSLVEGPQATVAGTGQPQSTPRGEWRAGEVPLLYQEDPAWGTASYAGDAFSESGCGPTCLAMVYVALTGKNDMDPADMGALSERMGCGTPEGTAWTFMTEGAAQLGLLAEELPADETSVRRALVAGSPVICSVGPGDFTTTGHFIVLVGIDQQGRLIVRDPNSPECTAQTWDFATVLGQSRAIWSYTAA